MARWRGLKDEGWLRKRLKKVRADEGRKMYPPGKIYELSPRAGEGGGYELREGGRGRLRRLRVGRDQVDLRNHVPEEYERGLKEWSERVLGEVKEE